MLIVFDIGSYQYNATTQTDMSRRHHKPNLCAREEELVRCSKYTCLSSPIATGSAPTSGTVGGPLSAPPLKIGSPDRLGSTRGTS